MENCPTPKGEEVRELAVPRMINRAFEQAEELGEAIRMLEERLCPILDSQKSPESSKDSQAKSEVPLADDLSKLGTRLKELAIWIREIKDRLEI